MAQAFRQSVESPPRVEMSGRALSADARRPSPVPVVMVWATVGAALLSFEVFVLLRWILGANFAPTSPGTAQISGGQQALFLVLQIVLPIAAVAGIWFWVIRPWRREGRLTTDGMLALSGAMIFFWDMCMNFTSVTLLYNSGMVNFGAWATGSWPGWISPHANRLPEPIFVTMPGYTALVFSQVMLILFVMRKIKAKRPMLSPLAVWPILFLGLTLIDTIIESALLRMGIYAYPGGIRWLTLYSGETYQLPMTEPVFSLGSPSGLSRR